MLIQIIRELGIPDTIDNMVQWDRKHVLAMMLNILMGRTALYSVEEFYENFDAPFLFGTDAQSSDFNDSILRRILDTIFDAGPKKVFSAAALQVARRGESWCCACGHHILASSWGLYRQCS